MKNDQTENTFSCFVNGIDLISTETSEVPLSPLVPSTGTQFSLQASHFFLQFLQYYDIALAYYIANIYFTSIERPIYVNVGMFKAHPKIK